MHRQAKSKAKKKVDRNSIKIKMGNEADEECSEPLLLLPASLKYTPQLFRNASLRVVAPGYGLLTNRALTRKLAYARWAEDMSTWKGFGVENPLEADGAILEICR
mmetsp:Transcript_22385/g.76707  ORF Transcript_22385/g.76707 Transcript_22385/m.76707 type:complete len:105 (+) Transcript_22385:65-379(+)